MSNLVLPFWTASMADSKESTQTSKSMGDETDIALRDKMFTIIINLG